MQHRLRTALLTTTALAVAVPALAVSVPAHAAARDGGCNSGEFCLYFNSDEKGSVSDFTGSIPDYGASQPSCYEFRGSGAGKGQCVKNHAASVWNRSSKTVRVYFNSNYGGAHQDFKPGARGNLNSTLKNENASHQFLGSGGGGGGGSTVGASKPRDDFDHRTRGFAANNCTAFAAYRIATRLGVPGFTHTWRMPPGHTWGNAGQWAASARQAGLTVDRTPKPGAIAVNVVHKVGHVAYVNQVYADGSFDVEEYNWTHEKPGRYDTRKHLRISNAQAAFQYMIHF